MSRFAEGPQLSIAVFKDEQGKLTWATSAPFGFILGSDNEPWTTVSFVVPQGFYTDLGTIPWFVRWLFNPASPRSARAYILHDYVNSLTAERPPGPGVWSSHLAAAVLYEALALDGEPRWSRKLQYLGVVLGIARKEW